MFDLNRITNLLNEYDNLIEELSRILHIMNSYARNITSVNLKGDVFEVSYDDHCMGQWGHDDSNIPFSLLGKSEADILAYVAEQKRIREEVQRIATELHIKNVKEQTRLAELAELNRLKEKYPEGNT